MDGSPIPDLDEAEPQDISLEELARRLDIIGQQMDWLIDNLAGLFSFVNQMSQNGGGIMGLMKSMKGINPEMLRTPVDVVPE